MVKVRHGPAAVTLFVPFQFKGKSFSKQKATVLESLEWEGTKKTREVRRPVCMNKTYCPFRGKWREVVTKSLYPLRSIMI